MCLYQCNTIYLYFNIIYIYISFQLLCSTCECQIYYSSTIWSVSDCTPSKHSYTECDRAKSHVCTQHIILMHSSVLSCLLRLLWTDIQFLWLFVHIIFSLRLRMGILLLIINIKTSKCKWYEIIIKHSYLFKLHKTHITTYCFGVVFGLLRFTKLFQLKCLYRQATKRTGSFNAVICLGQACCFPRCAQEIARAASSDWRAIHRL